MTVTTNILLARLASIEEKSAMTKERFEPDAPL